MNEVDAALYDERMRYVLEYLQRREMAITRLETELKISQHADETIRCYLIDRCEAAEAERDHWRKNHDHQVQRNAVLRERPDLPVDRIPAIARYEQRIADLELQLQEKTHGNTG